jgi:hypothetical protein
MNLIAHGNTMDRKLILQYVIPITLLVFTNCTVVWHVTDTDGGPERLYGFPLPYATSAFACSFCNVIGVFPLIIDLACVALVVTAAIFMLAAPINRLKDLCFAARRYGRHMILNNMGIILRNNNETAAAAKVAPAHICAGAGLTAATSAPGLGPSLPHLRRDWGSLLRHLHRDSGSPCPHLHRD